MEWRIAARKKNIATLNKQQSEREKIKIMWNKSYKEIKNINLSIHWKEIASMLRNRIRNLNFDRTNALDRFLALFDLQTQINLYFSHFFFKWFC